MSLNFIHVKTLASLLASECRVVLVCKVHLQMIFLPKFIAAYLANKVAHTLKVLHMIALVLDVLVERAL